MTPPLNDVERQAALAATTTALRNHSHAGIRPKRQHPRPKTFGTHVTTAGPIGADDAIARARATWPSAKKFSVFGADKFTSNGMVSQADLEGLAAEGDGGDGLFDGAIDFGEFSCDPSLDLAAVDDGDDCSDDELDGGDAC